MVVLAGLLAGILWGVVLARRRGGRGLDQAQYAAGFGIAFALLGLFATIALERLL